MATKRRPTDDQKGDQNLPRGIRFYLKPNRPKPFFVEWREFGKRKTLAFELKSERQVWTDDFMKQRHDNGAKVVAAFDGREWARWIEFKRIVGDEADPLQIALEWKQRQGEAKVALADAAERYLAARKIEGMGDGTYSHATVEVKRLKEFFGAVTLGEITPERVRALMSWMATKYSAHTVRGHRKRLCALFNWAKREGISSGNPCESVAPPARVEEEVSTLTVEDAVELFKTAWKKRPAAAPRLALEAFAGLRFSSAARLVKEDVNFADKGVTLPAAKIKTRRRHYIEGLPDNLWVWLKAATDETWTMTERQYLEAKSDTFELAGVTNPGNVLRHSFCSYHVSLHADAARTAVILCHASPRTLYQHYRGRATAADGKKYFGIVPGERN